MLAIDDTSKRRHGMKKVLTMTSKVDFNKLSHSVKKIMLSDMHEELDENLIIKIDYRKSTVDHSLTLDIIDDISLD